MSLAFEERWANPPEGRAGTPGPATVPAGAGVVPAGTVEPWVMSGGWDQFPQAIPSPVVDPPVILRVFDLADPREIILVTDSRAGTWQVTRGDGGSPVVAHTPGFAVYNAITGAGLAAKTQGLPSRNGLVLPNSGLASDSGIYTDGGARDVVSLGMAAAGGRNEVVPGAIYEALVWGYYYNTGAGQSFNARVFWNVQSLGSVAWPCPRLVTLADAARWRIHVVVNVFSGEATCSGMLSIADRNAVDLAQLPYTVLFGRIAPININGADPVPFRVEVQQAGGWWVQGRRSWKAA